MQSIEVSTIAHATDDLQKVLSALHFLLPASLTNREIFTRRYLEGHHHNPIVTFEARLGRPTEANAFAKHLLEKLPRQERMSIEKNLERYSDAEGNLYIRIDKQRALLGIMQLGEEDPIRVKLKFSRLGGHASEKMKEYLEAR